MKKSIRDFRVMKRKNEPVAWITAYDYPMAYCAEQAGVDMILVGDSGAMVQLGYSTTNPASMEEMITMAKAARRGAPDTFIVGDMPQGSYEVSNEKAVENAVRFIKEAGCDAVKLEGGRRMCDRIKAIVDAGILVIGHLGLTPQSTQSFGGYRVQGKTPKNLDNTLLDALSLQESGISILLLEALPQETAEIFRNRLEIPVYGIGAGVNVDGQLIIMHDLLGLYKPFRPHFAKCYIKEAVPAYISHIGSFANLKQRGVEYRDDGLLFLIKEAISIYAYDVKTRKYPSEEYSYTLSEKGKQKLAYYLNKK